MDKFQCFKCGACCCNLDKSIHFAEYHNGDGICKHLDKSTKLCTVYNERPLLCNIDEAYDAHFKTYLSRDEYHMQNHKACEGLRNIEAKK